MPLPKLALVVAALIASTSLASAQVVALVVLVGRRGRLVRSSGDRRSEQRHRNVHPIRSFCDQSLRRQCQQHQHWSVDHRNR